MTIRTRRAMQALGGAVLLLASAGPVEGQGRDPGASVRDALAAMGGEEAVRALRTRRFEFRTVNMPAGQEQWPGGARPMFISEGTDTWDLQGGRRATTTRAVGQPVWQRVVVTPTAAMVQRDTVRTPGSTTQLEGTRTALRALPDRLLLAASAAPGSLAPLPAREWRGRALEGVRYQAGADTVALWFDRSTRLLAATERTTTDPVFGRRSVMTTYTRWGRVDDRLLLPHEVVVEIDGEPASQTVLANQRVNLALDDSVFSIPASVGAPRPPATGVAVAEIAPGVHHVAGGSHASLAVVQGDSIVLVEAPLSAARTGSVLDTLAARFPGKPVRLVVATHHHVDHISGIPTVFERGIRVAAPEGVARYVAGAGLRGAAPSRPRNVVPVRDSAVVGSGAARLVLYSLPSAHAESMLVAYHPGSRTLFQADLFPALPEVVRALHRFVRDRGLAVDRVAGSHGAVTSWDAFQRAANP